MTVIVLYVIVALIPGWVWVVLVIALVGSLVRWCIGPAPRRHRHYHEHYHYRDDSRP